MTKLASADGNNEAQVENGILDEEQLLNNGVADRIQITANALDSTDKADVPDVDIQKPSLFLKNNKRKFKAYDTKKCSRIGLAPLTAQGVRLKNTIKRESGSTWVGLVLAIFCILLTIALILCFFLWPVEEHSKAYPVCVKPSCLRSSEQILPKLNSNASPCSDFRNYACGSWFSSNPLPKEHYEWNMKKLLQFNYRQKVHKFLMRKTISSDYSLLWKMNQFYQSCMNMEILEERLLKNDIKTLGGWDVLNDFEKGQRDTQKMMEELHSRFRVSPFFQIEVVPDRAYPKQNIILLKPPALGLLNVQLYSQKWTSPIIEAYTRYIKDITQLLGATVVDATQFSENLFHFEQRIAERLVNRENISQPHFTRMKIRELDPQLRPIRLYEILFKTLPKANLNQDINVLVQNVEYFRKLPSLITYSAESSLHSYLIWCLVAKHVPYLSNKFVKTLDFFKKELSDQPESVPRWEFCMITMQKFAGFGLLALFENEMQNEEKERMETVVREIFSETFSTIKKNLVQMKHTAIQENMIAKTRSLAIQIGLSSNMLQPKYIDDYYENFMVFKHLYENVVNGETFILGTFQRMLKEPHPEDSWLSDMISTSNAITYNAATNYIIVPLPLLQKPYFENEYPLSSHYGGIGVEMAKAVITSLLSNESDEEKNVYISTLSKCILGKDFSQLNIIDRPLFVITLAALKYSHRCLKYDLSLIEHTHQPAMETFESEQLFFIYYVQSICTVKTEKEQHYEVMLSAPLNDSILSNTLLAELPEFTDLYACKYNSKYSNSLCPL